MNSLRAVPPAPLWPWLLLLAGLVGIYFFGLDSAYAPVCGLPPF